MNRIAKVVVACSMSMGLAVPALAHHSAAAFDTTKEVKLTGTVKVYTFKNPHVYMTVEVKKPDGSTNLVEVEAGAASVLNPLGFTRESVKVGEAVTITGNPGRNNPDKLMLGKDLFKSDGTYYPLNISSRSVYAGKTDVATSIAGTWHSPRTEFTRFLGGARGWSVTDKAREAQRGGADPKATTQKDCIPIGAPALMFYPVATTITVQRDRVILDVDWMDSERTVYLDGRKPPANQTSLHGFSTGRWEDKTLVVETVNFREHPMGLSTNLPSSTQKRLIERFSLSPDGKSLIYSGSVEDPVYLAKPIEWTGRWEYRPGMPHSNQKCDVEVARKFLLD
ncbi:MAG TPA: DUF6152 family protein [Terriglobia bacterium]|nr:DUF6152 family protein [Terriglobia bacterium]